MGDTCAMPVGEPCPLSSDQLIDREILSSLTETFAGDEEGGLGELFESFFEHMPPRLAALRDSVVQRDVAAAKTLAHSLKGSAANFGASAVARICANLERQVAASPEFIQEAGPLAAEAAIVYAQTELELRRIVNKISGI